ncbi:MAG: HAD-IA family hydrolase [Acidobacteriota bacterium]|nr:HAD-IA family hydrolase [Acidobacteriota bacterium]
MSLPARPFYIACKGVLFDMDGILISSLGSVERSWTKWARLRGVDPQYAMSVVHGRRAIDSVIRLRPDLDAEAELKIIEDFEVEDNEGLQVLPGVLQLLYALPANGWTVVTSATERLARVRLAAGGIPAPQAIVTAERVTYGKPHPEPFLAGAALLGLAPRDCVAFEDSASGAQAAREAGCTVIATTFSHPASELSAAHYLVTDMTGVSASVREGQPGFTLALIQADQ